MGDQRFRPLDHRAVASGFFYIFNQPKGVIAKMKYEFEVEAEDVYNYVEYKIIIRNARKVKIRLFLTNLLLKWAKKVFPGTMTIEENTDFTTE